MSVSRRLPAAYCLAAAGFVFFLWAMWTWTAWILHGPAPVTKFRDPDSVSWVAARIFEGVAGLLAIGVAAFVIRGCRRERRLTFDAMFCLAGALTFWIDPFVNFLQPAFMYSSNWLNLQTWCGHAPLIVNPDCGRLPEPILFAGVMYVFGLTALSYVVAGFMEKCRQRRPEMSNAKLIAVTALAGVAIDFAFEVPIVWSHLWGYPGSPQALSLLGNGHRLPVIEVIAGGLTIAGFGVVRYFRDDRGQTVVERGLDGLAPGARKVVSVLALAGALQLLFVIDLTAVIVGGLYSDPYPKLPAHFVNGVCDAGGFSGTRYGPCPGSPGYRAPLRSLPGDAWHDPPGMIIPTGQ